MLVDLEPLSRATVQRVSVAVSQLELDVFVMGFHGPWAEDDSNDKQNSLPASYARRVRIIQP